MKKHKGEIIDSFVKNYAEEKAKRPDTGFDSITELLSGPMEARWELSFKFRYVANFTQRLKEIADKLKPTYIFILDSGFLKQRNGVSTEIRFREGEENILTLTIFLHSVNRIVYFIVASSEFAKLTPIHTFYEHSMDEFSAGLLEDIVTKSLSSFYLSSSN